MMLLSRAEEIVLLAIIKRQGEAYGVTIRDQIYADIGRRWSFGVIYKTLKKMKIKDYVKKYPSDPVSARGGRSRYYYELTAKGRQALAEIHGIHSAIWSGVRGLTPEK